jgi:hypothetical protein
LDDILILGILKLGLSRSQFFDLSPVEFEQALKLDKIIDEDESRHRDTLDTLRLSTLVLINSQRLAKDQIKDPKKLWLYYWENEEEIKNSADEKPFSDKEAERLEKLFPLARKQIKDK